MVEAHLRRLAGGLELNRHAGDGAVTALLFPGPRHDDPLARAHLAELARNGEVFALVRAHGDAVAAAFAGLRLRHGHGHALRSHPLDKLVLIRPGLEDLLRRGLE